MSFSFPTSPSSHIYIVLDQQGSAWSRHVWGRVLQYSIVEQSMSVREGGRSCVFPPLAVTEVLEMVDSIK